MEINLWQAYNSKKISVDISKELKDKIKIFLKEKIQKIAIKIKINPARLYDYFIYQKTPIPLDKLMKILKLMGIPYEEMQKQIISYKQKLVPIKNSVINPILPIRITPYLTSIISNLYFDGSVPKDGKGTYYNQKERKIMEDFIKRIISIFGEVNYSLTRDHRGVLKLRLPRIIGEICKKTYGIDSFGTFDSKVPGKIFTLNKDHKKAFLLAAISDEGSISYDGNIYFGVSNKDLCQGVKKLCYELNIETTEIKSKKDKIHFYFRIISKRKLLDLIETFSKKYPLLDLNNKRKRLESYFEIIKEPGIRNKRGGNERKKKIIHAIKLKEKSPNELSKELLIPPRTVRRHLYVLINKGKIKRRKFGVNYLYISTTPH